MAKRAKPKRETVGIVGLGLMGRAFAGSLLADGHPVVGTDPDPAARAKFKRMGGSLLASPREVAEAAGVVLLSLPNSKVSIAAAGGREGFLACAPRRRPRAVVDTTTADPEDARKLARLCRRRGVDFADACVSGHSENVRNRVGLFLVGGEARVHRKVKGLLARLLSDQIHCGPAGMGATMKVIINYLTCMQRCAIAETLRLGLRAGVKGPLLIDALSRSAADSRQLRNRGPKMIRRAFKRPVSTIDTLAKDIGLGLKLAARARALTPVGSASAPIYKQAVRSGYGPLDSAAVYRVFEDREQKKRGGRP